MNQMRILGFGVIIALGACVQIAGIEEPILEEGGVTSSAGGASSSTSVTLGSSGVGGIGGSGGYASECVSGSDCPGADTECATRTCTMSTCGLSLKPPESPCTTGVCDGNISCVQCVTSANCMGDFSCSMNTCFDCNNGTKDGTESDVDCGRDCVAKCADGMMCNDGVDCFYSTCDNNICVSCFDGTRNFTESDVDCGGFCGATCGVNKKCNTGADCTTGVCNAGTKLCSAPTCSDMVKNGTETDVDCGGACPKCVVGKNCKTDVDCIGGIKCIAGVCV